jgi:Pro-kumamolisin, activation domain/Subtilase family
VKRLAVLLLVGALATTASAGIGRARRLKGSVPGALAQLERGPSAPADLPLRNVVVFLGARDRLALDGLVAALQDPRATLHGQWLDRAELADRFGPSPAEYERVRRWFRVHGFRIVRDSPLRTMFVAAGTAEQAAAALKAPIHLFRHRGRTFHGPIAAPALPADIRASVRGVYGLDDLPKFRPLVQLPDGTAGCQPGSPCNALAPADFAHAYGAEPLQAAGFTGAGRSIAVVGRSNYRDEDMALFFERYLPAPRPLPVRKFVDNDPGILDDDAEALEVVLDAQWAAGLAPGATVNVVIGSGNNDILLALVQAVDGREGDVITISFGLCENVATDLAEVFDVVYAFANAQGQTVLVASGDFGASDCLAVDPPLGGLAVSGLASSPHAIAVGGTSFALAADGTVADPLVEQVWNDGLFAGGGGESIVFARPRYQFGPGVPVSDGRVLPDVSVAGDPSTPGYVVVENGADQLIGGTSAGAPALAGVLALVNEARGTQGLGQLLPSLYRLGGEQQRGQREPVFRDVTQGSNAVEKSGGFAAGPGFDLASGWGAPLADRLAAGIADPVRCEVPLFCLVPGTARKSRGCVGEWLLEHTALALRRNDVPKRVQRCRDGDPACDADGAADGRCTINVGFCVNVFDPRLVKSDQSPACPTRRIRGVRILRAGGRRRDLVAADNRRSLRALLGGLPPLPTRLRSACTATAPVVVPAGGKGKTRVRARIKTGHGAVTSTVALTCDPAAGG